MTNDPSRGRLVARRWPVVAAVTLASLIGGASSAWLVQPARRSAADCACAPDDRLRGEVAMLRRELERLSFAVQVSSETGPGRPVQPGSTAPGAASTAPPEPGGRGPQPRVEGAPEHSAGTGGRRYTRFDVPSSLVAVRQEPTGELVVRNFDPSLTGSTLKITAFSSDTGAETIQVVVPPPDRP